MIVLQMAVEGSRNSRAKRWGNLRRVAEKELMGNRVEGMMERIRIERSLLRRKCSWEAKSTGGAKSARRRLGWEAARCGFGQLISDYA